MVELRRELLLSLTVDLNFRFGIYGDDDDDDDDTDHDDDGDEHVVVAAVAAARGA